MKIERIKVTNFVGISALDIKLEAPILGVFGPNCSGKSSLAQSLAFVLTDSFCRVNLKRDIKSLVREGSKNGSVELVVDGVTYQRSAATGHIVSKDQPPEPHPALRYCLDPSKFASMEPNARRAFLFNLMGVKNTTPAIIAQLKDRGHTPTLLASIAIHLSSGFPTAHTECMGIGRGLKTVYREITGENYGEVKAATWAIDAPEVAPSDIDRLRTEAAVFEAEMGRLLVRRGAIVGRERERNRLIESQKQTRYIAERLDANRTAEAECRKRIDALNDEEQTARLSVQEAESKAIVQAHITQGAFFHCPVCHTHLVYSRGECKVGEPGSVDVSNEIAAAEARAKQARKNLSKICARDIDATDALRHAIQATARSQMAVEALKQINLIVADDPEAESGADIDGLLADAKAGRDSALAALAALEAAAKKHHEAISTTARATAIHEEIKAAAALAADLAPDGLPAELLAKVMRPINDRLRDSAIIAGWSSVSITTDEIFIHSRPWALASSSEHWRANAMIAEAIAHLSGIKCFVLDGGDILEPAARAQCITWLSAIAGEMDTIILMMTLKQRPTGLPPEVQNCWIGS